MAAAQSQLPSKSPGTSTPPPPPANAPACPSSGLDLRLAGASSASGAARAFEVVNATGSACSLPTVPAVTVLYNSGASGPLRATPEGEAAQRSSLVVPSGQAATYTVAEPPCGSATGGPPPAEGSVIGLRITYGGHIFIIRHDFGLYLICPLTLTVFQGAASG
ncbi:MAG: DUF4232 domain-containing protein [Mycobacteriales bacterium]